MTKDIKYPEELREEIDKQLLKKLMKEKLNKVKCNNNFCKFNCNNFCTSNELEFTLWETPFTLICEVQEDVDD